MGTHFLVFGGTSPSGIAFCRLALSRGHRVTNFARNPSKFPEDIQSHEQSKIIQGTFEDLQLLEEAAKCGADVFVSFAGPAAGALKAKNTPITQCYKKLLPLLASNNIKRAFILCTPSYHDKSDSSSYLWSAMIGFLKLTYRPAYEEMVAIGSYVTTQSLEELGWTVFRVGMLKDGPAKPVEATFVGTGHETISITRESIAEWLLTEYEEKKWIGKCPYICNK